MWGRGRPALRDPQPEPNYNSVDVAGMIKAQEAQGLPVLWASVFNKAVVI